MTPNSKNIYIDKLDDIVSKYHKKCNGTINMNLVDVKSSTYVDSSKEIMIKILNLKVNILLAFQNIEPFLQIVMFKICSKKFLWLENLKELCRGLMLLVILKVKKWNVLQNRISKNKSKRVYS